MGLPRPKTCTVCGVVYRKANDTYCSRKCYNVGRLKPRIEGDCERCGKHFVSKYPVTHWQYNNRITRRFCSIECRDKGKIKTPSPCKTCGKVRMLYPSDVKLGRGNYCSKKCAGIAKSGENSPRWVDKPKFICIECGKQFVLDRWRIKDTKRGQFCSQTCHYKQIESTSSIKIRWDYEWLHIRAEFLAKRPYCKKCGSTEELEVDHIIPRAIDESKFKDPKNLQVLCSNCHKDKTKRDIQRILRAKRTPKP